MPEMDTAVGGTEIGSMPGGTLAATGGPEGTGAAAVMTGAIAPLGGSGDKSGAALAGGGADAATAAGAPGTICGMPAAGGVTAGCAVPDAGRGGAATGFGGTEATGGTATGGANDGVCSGGNGGSGCANASGGASEIGDESRRGFGGGASLRGGCESWRTRPGSDGGSDVGCDGATITGGAGATAAGDGVVTSNAAGSSRFMMIGAEGIATRGGAFAKACEGGGRLGVPTESTGWLWIFGRAVSSSSLVLGGSGRSSGGLLSLMRA